jgi:starch phosphorylase
MNEGHSALLGVERIRMLMAESGATFEEARLPVTAATVFTTHTAVAAGIDLFSPELVRRHLGNYYESMGLDERTFIGLGRINPDDQNEPFSMALLGLRLSGYRNGVSKLHGTVSRRLWEAAWPNLPDDQTPIDAITNGVHLPTWVSHEMGVLFDRYVGPQWRDDPTDVERWSHVRDVPDSELWNVHERQREALIHRAREQHAFDAAQMGLSTNEPLFGRPLDPRTLTIGFARRFAGYKRATLLFRDLDRLDAIVNNPQRPVQFIFAGKAHPRDEPAKQLIREVIQYSRLPEFRDRLVLLERYDVDLARSLVQGCDVWLNTPLRPLEASGTSGMKAAANGALQCSVLDGWWWEGYRSDAGWAIGRDRVDDDPELQDALDAASLYSLLENDISTAFYDRDADGIPRQWIAKMKASIAAYAPVFNTSRMVAEYAVRAYAPAAHSWHNLLANGLEVAKEQAAWLRRIKDGWNNVQVLAVRDDVPLAVTALGRVSVTARVQLAPLTPDDVRIDLLHGRAALDGELETAREGPLDMTPLDIQEQAEDGSYVFGGGFEPAIGGRIGYAIRILPRHPQLHDPFAAGLVQWA